jgi:hypothetical protein
MIDAAKGICPGIGLVAGGGDILRQPYGGEYEKSAMFGGTGEFLYCSIYTK